MNVLYILGNGFDKAQGLKTSYPEFYEYLEKQNGSDILQKMKADIQSDKKLWSDMEKAFGEFTTKINTEREFQDLYYELSDHLQNHLKSEDDRFTPSGELKNKFMQDFSFYGKYLGDLDKIRYENFLNSFRGSHDINVMTFNYTNTLEKLLNIKQHSNRVEANLGNNKYLRNIIHVHGGLEDAIIIGVDNEEQIKDETFKSNDNIKDLLIKIQSNHAMKFTKHEICENFIKESHLIIIYGTSLGYTDLRWWNLIGIELKKRDNLAIIQHLYQPNAISPTRRQLLGGIERMHQNKLIEKMNIKQEEFSKRIANKLFFTVNSNIFKK